MRETAEPSLQSLTQIRGVLMRTSPLQDRLEDSWATRAQTLAVAPASPGVQIGKSVVDSLRTVSLSKREREREAGPQTALSPLEFEKMKSHGGVHVIMTMTFTERDSCHHGSQAMFFRGVPLLTG